MSSWHSYSKIYALGHRATRELMDGEVLIEEKVDGSQFSFGLHDGELLVRSRGRCFDVHAPDGMFMPVCETVKRLHSEGLLHEGWTYRGETLQKPKHNALTYSRVPVGFIILWDIETDLCTFLTRAEKEAEAARIGLEIVPVLFQGVVKDQSVLDNLKGTKSILGGTKVEGFVVKAYDKFDVQNGGKVLMGKWVSEAFKEVHRKEWKADNPTNTDIIEQITDTYTNQARWRKAVQHLAEAGKLDHSPVDISSLIKEIKQDVRTDAQEEIKQALFDYAWKRIERGLVRGFPEWYKQRLMEGLFE